MNFEELQAHTRDILNFNPTQANSDFTTNQVKNALNICYMAEVERVKFSSHPAYFLTTGSFSWTAAAEEVAIPDNLLSKDLIAFYDITDDANGPGTRLELGWADKSTLRWGSSGPSSARTIEVVYYAKPAKMVADVDTPDLMPDEFHDMLCWSAAIYMRDMADEEAPVAWHRRLEDRRLDLAKRLSRRPAGTPNKVIQDASALMCVDTY